MHFVQNFISFFLFSLVFDYFYFLAHGSEIVTYGSLIRILHPASTFSLFSAKMTWGTSENEQIVTAAKNQNNDDTFLWIVKNNDDLSKILKERVTTPVETKTSIPLAFGAGTPVLCNSIIRLEHFTTKFHLYGSLNSAALIKKNAEVAAHKSSEEHLSEDNFRVECKDSHEKFWTTDSLIRLHHVNHQYYITTSSKIKYNHENCPNCPIIGHQEVSLLRRYTSLNSKDILWKAQMILGIEGFSEENEPLEQSSANDEL